MRYSFRVRALAILAAVLLPAAAAQGAGSPLAPALAVLPRLEQAAVAARAGDPAAVQARYDRARDLAELLRGAVPPRGCRALAGALAALARAHVAAAEAFDRRRAATALEGAASHARRRAERLRADCRSGTWRRRPALRAGDPLAGRLPAAALRRSRPARVDARLARRLAAAARAFPGTSGIWVHELATGRAAGLRADAGFPAASTVKLGVLVEALRHASLRPETSAAHDLRALAGWSSNLAANRLVRLLGGGDSRRGARLVEERLHRLGAGASTYPGDYRVGTSRRSRAASRTTTPRDLGRLLTTLHDAAAGDRAARDRAGLTVRRARLAVALLLASRPAGDNRGLIAHAVPAGVPIAQKHGWLASARHTAAIVYAPRGPVVVVVMTQRLGLSRAEAAELGGRVVRAVGVG